MNLTKHVTHWRMQGGEVSHLNMLASQSIWQSASSLPSKHCCSPSQISLLEIHLPIIKTQGEYYIQYCILFSVRTYVNCDMQTLFHVPICISPHTYSLYHYHHEILRTDRQFTSKGFKTHLPSWQRNSSSVQFLAPQSNSSDMSKQSSSPSHFQWLAIHLYQKWKFRVKICAWVGSGQCDLKLLHI